MLNRYVFPTLTVEGSNGTVVEFDFPAAKLLKLTDNTAPLVSFRVPLASVTVIEVAVTVPVFFIVILNDASGLAPEVFTTLTSVTVISATADPVLNSPVLHANRKAPSATTIPIVMITANNVEIPFLLLLDNILINEIFL